MRRISAFLFSGMVALGWVNGALAQNATLSVPPGQGAFAWRDPAARGAPRAPPSQGGTVGTVERVSPLSFVISMPSGQGATVETGSATSYQKGRDSTPASAVTPGDPVLFLGIVADLQGCHMVTIKASRVIAQLSGIAATLSSGFAFGHLKPAAKREVGRIPASYVEGAGTIVNGTGADLAILPALAAYPNGLINRVVKLSDGSYEVHHIGVAWPHHIFDGADFKYVGAD